MYKTRALGEEKSKSYDVLIHKFKSYNGKIDKIITIKRTAVFTYFIVYYEIIAIYDFVQTLCVFIR